MKKSWIILLLLITNFIFLAGGVLGEETINFEYPLEVIVGEVFEVNLTLINFTEGVYDVKVDIMNNTNSSHRLSEILNREDNWVTTYQFVNNAINTSNTNSSIFQLNITKNYNGPANITIKIRQNGGSSEVYGVYELNISAAQNQDPPQNNDPEEPEPSLEIEWDEEDIINGDEFEIDVKAFNLEAKEYDLKIWIKFDDNVTIISDRYDEENEEWKSGNFYVDDFFTGPGNKTKQIELRIRDEHEELYGDDFEICFRLRDETQTEGCEGIEILEMEEEENDDNENDEVGLEVPVQTTTTNEIQTSGITGNVIRLGSPGPETEDLKEQNHILYKSKTELIKKYSIYAFAFFCAGLAVLLIWGKLK